MDAAVRRFTRLTNAFSKKIEMHMRMASLHYMNGAEKAKRRRPYKARTAQISN